MNAQVQPLITTMRAAAPATRLGVRRRDGQDGELRPRESLVLYSRSLPGHSA
jgi:hypothetical protein